MIRLTRPAATRTAGGTQANRRLSPITARGSLAMVGGLLLWLAGRVFGLFEIVALGVALLCAVGAGVVSVWVRPKPQLVVARRLRPPAVVVGDECRVEVRVRNDGPRRTGTLLVSDRVTSGRRRVSLWCASIPPGDQRIGHYRLPGDVRGPAALGPLRVTRIDLFGFAQRTVARGRSDELIVLPRTIPMPELQPAGGRTDDTHMRGTPVAVQAGNDEFAGLRPYIAGDDLRRIHWASSARVDDLLVRETVGDTESIADVLLDDRPESHTPASFELALEIAATLLLAARGTVRVRFRTTTRIAEGASTTRRNHPHDEDVLHSAESIVAQVSGLARLVGPAAPGHPGARSNSRLSGSPLPNSSQHQPAPTILPGATLILGPSSGLAASADPTRCTVVIADPSGAVPGAIIDLDQFGVRWPAIHAAVTGRPS